MVLETEKILFERDEEGKLIPQEVELVEEVDGKKETIFVIPLTRGERKKLMSGLDDKGDTTKDTDRDLVKKHCIKPKFDDDMIERAPFGLIENVALTILQASGLPVGKNSSVKKANQKIETDFPVA